jgi:hypothetical protein
MDINPVCEVAEFIEAGTEDPDSVLGLGDSDPSGALSTTIGEAVE